MPLPLLIPAIISGAAAVGSSVVNALGQRLSKAERARLKELEERKAKGQLGLTDEERVALDQEVKDPLRASMREEFLRSRAGSLADPGQAARASLARQDAATRALAEAGKQVAAINLEEKRRNEAELAGLYDARRGARAATGQAAAEIVGTGAAVAGDVVNLAGQAKADRELFRALYPDGTDAEMAEFATFGGTAPAKVAPAVDPALPPLRTDLEAFRFWRASGSPPGVAPFGNLPAAQLRALDAAASMRPPAKPPAPAAANPVDAAFFRALEGSDDDARAFYDLTSGY